MSLATCKDCDCSLEEHEEYQGFDRIEVHCEGCGECQNHPVNILRVALIDVQETVTKFWRLLRNIERECACNCPPLYRNRGLHTEECRIDIAEQIAEALPDD